MQKISLIATDLDGTLFYDRENIAQPDRDALRRLQACGLPVAVATGRELDAVTPALERLGLTDTISYIICSGGAMIHDLMDHTCQPIGLLTPDTLCDIYDRYAPYGMPIVFPIDGCLYTNLLTDRLRRESELLKSPIYELPDLKAVFTRPNGKIVFNGEQEQIDQMLPILSADPDERYAFFRSHDNYIDGYAAGVNKGSALTCLCEKLGIPVSQAAAIGDNHNDLDLLRQAGVSACPGDGADAAKAAADFICCEAHNGAFAHFCSWLGF